MVADPREDRPSRDRARPPDVAAPDAYRYEPGQDWVDTRPAWAADAGEGQTEQLPVVPGTPPADGLSLDLDRTARPRQERRAAAEAAKRNRAGRNLPAAIGVGVSLGAVVIASLFVWRPAFLGVIAVAATIAVWEMARAVRHDGGPRVPLVPLLAGAVVMEGLAWYVGVEALILGLTLTVLAAMVWRLADGPAGYQRDVTATALVAVYVPFLAGFAVLLVKPDDGALRVLVTLAGVVLSDTGGYVAGVFFGRHPMAPTVSPKKSWEGLAGSLVATAVGGALLLHFALHEVWWHGALFGLAVSAASVLGDLAESLLKRDLGVKDMSNLLPGHGGLMDRLDSVLFALPTAFVLLALLPPASG
jgi:phosphatidate cytidylyltransferase